MSWHRAPFRCFSHRSAWAGASMATARYALPRPSCEPAELAAKHFHGLPRVLRYMLRGLGARPGKSSDITSYLAFAPDYCGELVRLGYADAVTHKAELTQILGG